MIDALQSEFVWATAAAFVCFLSGVILWYETDRVLKPLKTAFFALSPFILFCWGTNALEVTHTVEQMLAERKPVEIRPASEQAETFWAAVEFKTEGGNHVRWRDGGQWTVASSGDANGSGWTGPVPAGIGCSGRSRSGTGPATEDIERQDRAALHVSTVDVVE